jgi:hypothetical protein
MPVLVEDLDAHAESADLQLTTIDSAGRVA